VTNPPPPNQPGQSADYPPGPGSHTSPPPPFQPPGQPDYSPPPGYGTPGPPPKKGSGNKTVFIILAVIFGGIILLCGLGGILVANAPKTTTTAGQASPDVTEPGAAAPEAPTAGASKDNPAPIGTTVTPAKDWSITVNSANLDATADLAKLNMFNKPRIAGNKLVTVNVTIHNGSSRPGMAMTAMKVGALPPSGVTVDESFAIVGVDTLNPSAQLQPGASVTGTLVYELAPADIAKTVLLVEPQLTLDQNEDQRFLAIQ
jgi:hypothetical protein